MRCRSKPWLGAAALMLVAAPVFAGEGAGTEVVDFGSPIAQETLDEQRGGRLELNLQETQATLEGNKAINTVNGSNVIKDGAFSHAAGLPIAVQNTGNNVIIQNAVILNLEVR